MRFLFYFTVYQSSGCSGADLASNAYPFTFFGRRLSLQLSFSILFSLTPIKPLVLEPSLSQLEMKLQIPPEVMQAESYSLQSFGFRT